jgi:hypothetical protein
MEAFPAKLGEAAAVALPHIYALSSSGERIFSRKMRDERYA